jgi:dTDP-4-amino-4,6-dideoxygalactose transaminase
MFVPYFKPWITSEDKKSVIKTLDNRWLTNGPNLLKFENKIKQFIGTNFAVGVGNATQALHLSLDSIGIGKGDEVIVPTFTFAATSNAVKYCGAEPILTDVDYDTFNISPNEIEKNITKRTKAIIVVHYGGQSCDMKKIIDISKKYNLSLIEDCAHSLGSTFNKKLCGNLGDVGCFSFYPTKIITTGEGGMLVTNNEIIYKQSRLTRSHGITVDAQQRESSSSWKYDITKLGFNYRLDELRSSLGVSQFSRITKINQMRQKIAQKYDAELKKIKGIIIPKKKSKRNHIYHLYTIKITNDYPLTRDELFVKLNKKGIGTSVQYFPLHLMSYNKKKYKNKFNTFPISNILKDQVLSLPIFPKMTVKQVEYVISNIKN